MNLELIYQRWRTQQELAAQRTHVKVAQIQTELLRTQIERFNQLIEGGKRGQR